jgi:hypothetical protein
LFFVFFISSSYIQTSSHKAVQQGARFLLQKQEKKIIN